MRQNFYQRKKTEDKKLNVYIKLNKLMFSEPSS